MPLPIPLLATATNIDGLESAIKSVLHFLRPAPVRQHPAGIGGENHPHQRPRKPRKYGGVPEPWDTMFAHESNDSPTDTLSVTRSWQPIGSMIFGANR
jgi:hypothetical protein